jgi:predicted PurR-regulated permease PerM
MNKKLIFYIILIVIILVLVLLSQQVYSRLIAKTLVSTATDQIKAYLSKGSNWAMSNIYPKISGEVQKREGMIQTEVDQEKQKISDNIVTQIENYFSGVSNSILHPGQTNNNCTTQPAQTSTGQ